MAEVVFAMVIIIIIAIFALIVFIIGNYRNLWMDKFEKDIESGNEPEKEGKDDD